MYYYTSAPVLSISYNPLYIAIIIWFFTSFLELCEWFLCSVVWLGWGHAFLAWWYIVYRDSLCTPRRLDKRSANTTDSGVVKQTLSKGRRHDCSLKGWQVRNDDWHDCQACRKWCAGIARMVDNLIGRNNYRSLEWMHGLINFIDTKEKCRHLKKLPWKRDFAAGVYQS